MNKMRRAFVMKQFSIAQNRVTLPVTSDACLFGAFIQLPPKAQVLDIGTGTGLLCFMMAQTHPEARFTGIDVHTNSISQALENLSNNPYKNRIQFLQANILNYQSNTTPNVIVCNPPFFENHCVSKDPGRRIARHVASNSEELTLSNLIDKCSHQLPENGQLFLLFPCANQSATQKTLGQYGFAIKDITYIQANENKPPHLAIFHALKSSNSLNHQSSAAPTKNNPNSIAPNTKNRIIHFLPNGKPTAKAFELLKEFYINLQ